MFMPSKYLKVAGMLLILVLSLATQPAKGEEAAAVSLQDLAAFLAGKDSGLENRAVIALDPDTDIGFNAPPAVLRVMTGEGTEEGIVLAEQCLQGTVLLADKEGDGSSFLWEELSTFFSGPAWYLVGRVRNTAEYAAELTLITWEVGGKDGQVLATAGGYITFLNPHESKPFKLMLPLRSDATWYRVELTPGFGARPRPVKLRGSADTYADRGMTYVSLLGHATNTDLERQDFVKVMVEFLDEAGRLLDVDWAFLNYLDPGQSQSFTVYTPRLETRQWRICFD